MSCEYTLLILDAENGLIVRHPRERPTDWLSLMLDQGKGPPIGSLMLDSLILFCEFLDCETNWDNFNLQSREVNIQMKSDHYGLEAAFVKGQVLASKEWISISS